MEDFLDFKVTSFSDFIEFIEVLRKDFLSNPNEWENTTINDYLEALGRYAVDIQGYYDNTGQDINANVPSWQTFADILRGASRYE